MKPEKQRLMCLRGDGLRLGKTVGERDESCQGRKPSSPLTKDEIRGKNHFPHYAEKKKKGRDGRGHPQRKTPERDFR